MFKKISSYTRLQITQTILNKKLSLSLGIFVAAGITTGFATAKLSIATAIANATGLALGWCWVGIGLPPSFYGTKIERQKAL